QLEEDRWPGQVQSGAPGGQSRGAGVASGGPESAPQPGGPGRLSTADERAAGGAGGRDRGGAQTSTHRLSGVEARDDVRGAEPGGVRGPDEGEADQGAQAEGTPVGTGNQREDVGWPCPGGRSAGGGIKEGRTASAVVG